MPLTVEYKPLKALIPYARNTRTHPRGQLQKLKASLGQFGWGRPMGIADGMLIYGHGILQAALEMAEEGATIPHNEDPWQGPTVDLSHLNAAQRQAYIIADNRLALDSGWDEELLRLEFDDLTANGFDVTLTGFDQGEIEDLFKGWSPDFDKHDKTPAEMSDLMALLRIKYRKADEELVVAKVKEALTGMEGVEFD